MVCVAAIAWGTWPLYARNTTLSPSSIALLCQLAMALPAPFVFERAALRDRRATLALVLVGLADAANAALYFAALAKGPVVVATLTHYLAPLLVALFVPFFTIETRSRRALWAAPVVLLGLGLVLSPSGPGSVLAPELLTTASLGAGSAVFYATLVIASRVAGRSYSAAAITSLHALVSAAALVVVSGPSILPAFDRSTAQVLVGCLINGLAAALLFNTALLRIGAQLTGVMTYLEPLTAALVGIIVFREPAGPLTALGASLVVACGMWVAVEKPRSEA